MEPELTPILRDLPTELLGERILIRPVQPGDGAAVWEAVDESREQIGPWLPWVAKTLSADDSEAAVRRGAAKWITREDVMVGIWNKETGRYLGGSGLHRIEWTVPAFEIGYWLRTSEWGKGYVSEAVQVLCRFAFETLAANRVEIRCDGRNVRSRAVPLRLGFVQEATLRNQVRDGFGELRDTLIFALTPDDYAGVKAHWDEGK
ncbi:MAG: GNAT family N-acetyltransferase [Janthinobacterium lividum]